MTANEYNHQAIGRTWSPPDLPSGLRDVHVAHGAHSDEFAEAVRKAQTELDVVADGKLGALTLDALRAADGERRRVVGGPDDGETWSPLTASVVKSRRKLHPRSVNKVGAILVHTTGSGIVAKARKMGRDPLDHAVAHYAGPKAYTSHYVMGWDGAIVGIVPENERALHAGVSDERRRLYQAGFATWARWLRPLNPAKPPLPAKVMDRDDGMVLYRDLFAGHLWWPRRWPLLPDPTRITSDPNGTTIGMDLLPAPEAEGGVHPGGFTDAQRDSLDVWVADVRRRLDRILPVLGHADVDPIVRCDAKGPWDPRCLAEWDVFGDAPLLLR